MEETIINKTGFDKYKIATYVIIIIAIFWVCRQVSIESTDKKAFTQNFFYNMITIILPIIVILALVMYLSFNSQFATAILVGSIIGSVIVFAFIYFMKTGYSKYFFNQYLLNVLIVLFVFVGLAIVFTIFSGKLRKLGGWTGFLANLLFYIPCMIQNGIRTLINDYNSLSNTVIILFAIEILIIIMYFFAFPMANEKAFPEKVVLQNDPMMLTTKYYLDNKLTDKTKSSCAISFWLYLNAAPDTKIAYSDVSPEATIFNYSDFSEKYPHIRIAYSNVDKGNNDYIIYVGTKLFRISLPFQKWHHFVINFITYDAPLPTATASGSRENTTPPVEKIYNTDIFIDGNLETSYSSDNAVNDKKTYNKDFANNDIIYVGNIDIGKGNSNTDGLYGAICNIVYHKMPLTKLAIVYKYNTLLLTNPPIE